MTTILFEGWVRYTASNSFLNWLTNQLNELSRERHIALSFDDVLVRLVAEGLSRVEVSSSESKLFGFQLSPEWGKYTWYRGFAFHLANGRTIVILQPWVFPQETTDVVVLMQHVDHHVSAVAILELFARVVRQQTEVAITRVEQQTA